MKCTSGLCELELDEKGSRQQVQGKLGEGYVEVAVVLFDLNIPLLAKQGIKIGNTILEFLRLEIFVNRQPE